MDWQAVLPRITCPALLITADPALGAIVSEAEAATLKSLIPQLRVAQIPGASHNIHREQFARYLGVVSAFLGEVAASGE